MAARSPMNHAHLLPARNSRRGLKCHVQLRATQSLATFAPQIYALEPMSGNQGTFWQRTGDQPPSLKSWQRHEQASEEMRGQTLPWFQQRFCQRHPAAMLKAMLSFGDCGVNRNRGLLTREQLVWIPEYIADLADDARWWLVGWQAGSVTFEQLRIEAMWDVKRGSAKPTLAKCDRLSGDSVLPHMSWALTGLPAIVKGVANMNAVVSLDDDLRHHFATPRGHDGLYILEKALLDARDRGWRDDAPVEVDLALYGDDVATTIAALTRTGYRQVYAVPERPGEFQLISPDRMVAWPQVAGYAINLFGLCRDGHYGSFIARAQPSDCGYFGPSVADQIRMVAPYFEYAIILDEGLDPTFYDLSVPPEQFPVRGQPGGRLSGMICIYEP